MKYQAIRGQSHGPKEGGGSRGGGGGGGGGGCQSRTSISYLHLCQVGLVQRIIILHI